MNVSVWMILVWGSNSGFLSRLVLKEKVWCRIRGRGGVLVSTSVPNATGSGWVETLGPTWVSSASHATSTSLLTHRWTDAAKLPGVIDLLSTYNIWTSLKTLLFWNHRNTTVVFVNSLNSIFIFCFHFHLDTIVVILFCVILSFY